MQVRLWFQVNDSVSKGVFSLGQRFDSSYDVPVGHTRESLINRDEDSICFRGVLE